MWQTVSNGGFDCVRVNVGDFYGGGDFGDGLDGGDGCSQVAVAAALIFHIGGIHCWFKCAKKQNHL